MLFGACKGPEIDDAKVYQVNGISVFILSQPKSEFKVLGTVDSDFKEQWNNATDKKTTLEKIAGALTVTSDNMTMKNKIDIMVNKVKDDYSNANGIVFDSELNTAKAVLIK